MDFRVAPARRLLAGRFDCCTVDRCSASFGTGDFPGCRNGPGVMHAIALAAMRGKSSKPLDLFRGVERNPKTTATSTARRNAAKATFRTPDE